MRLFEFQKPLIFAIVSIPPLIMHLDTLFAADAKPQLSQFSQIERAVQAYFQQLPDYELGDIITRSQVEPLLRREKSLSWLSAEQPAILNQLLEDDDFLVTQLRTQAGRRFLSQISKYPNGLDRLDRLSRLSQGRKAVDNIIHVRDGYKLIETLATTPNGTALGNVLSKTQEGADFNKPTGRIYTQALLLTRLKQLYQEKEKAAKTARPTK